MVVFCFEAVYNVIDSFSVLNVGPNMLCVGLNICIHDLYQVVYLKQMLLDCVRTLKCNCLCAYIHRMSTFGFPVTCALKGDAVSSGDNGFNI